MVEAHETFFDGFPKNPSPDIVLNIESLLHFSQNIITFCELQGPALYLVKNDVGGNIKKISNAGAKYNVTTVKELLIREKDDNCCKNNNSGTIGLLWLTRALELILQVLVELSACPDGDMQEIVRSAYSKTLKRHHNLFMRKLFETGLALFPKKDTFLLRLAYNKENMETRVLEAMKEFVGQYGNMVEPLQQLLVQYGAESCPPPEYENPGPS